MCEHLAARVLQEGGFIDIYYGNCPPDQCPKWDVLPEDETIGSRCFQCAGEDEAGYRVLRGWASHGRPSSPLSTATTSSSDYISDGVDDAASSIGDATEDEARSAGRDQGFEAAFLAERDRDWGRGHDDGWNAFAEASIDDPDLHEFSSRQLSWDTLPVQDVEDPYLYSLGYEAGWNAGRHAAASLAFCEGYQMGLTDLHEQEIFLDLNNALPDAGPSAHTDTLSSSEAVDSEIDDTNQGSHLSGLRTASYFDGYNLGIDLARIGARNADFHQRVTRGLAVGSRRAFTDGSVSIPDHVHRSLLDRAEDASRDEARRLGFVLGFGTGVLAAHDDDFSTGYDQGQRDFWSRHPQRRAE